MKRKYVIPKAVRTSVWNNYVGADKGIDICFVGCGNPITQSNFECGHIISEKNGGDTTIENLRPICGNCNKSIGAKNMEEFISKHGIKKHPNWDRIVRMQIKKILLINNSNNNHKINTIDKTITLSSNKFVFLPITDIFGCSDADDNTFKIETDNDNNIICDNNTIRNVSKTWLEENFEFSEKILRQINKKYHVLVIS